MPRTEEAESWFAAVYDAVQQIPRGKVTSYGHIARLLGEPQRSRQVGVCLKHLPSSQSQHADADGDAEVPFYNDANVPWQRVINSKGMISHRGPGAASRQAVALRAEGVEVTGDAMGELYVDFSVWGWFPRWLPGEEGDSSSEDVNGNGDGQGEAGV